jgi:type II secretory pathway pseudopilin PulG
MSLLEVVLAVAILGICIAIIGEAIRIGTRQAEESREMTTAQLLCESKLEELACGASPLESVTATAFELNPEWTYTIEPGSVDAQNLVQVRVTVQQAESNRLLPLSFSLTRWMLDPTVANAAEEAETSTESPADTSNTNSGSGTGTSSGTQPTTGAGGGANGAP